jgi:hypothetical protein
VASDGLGLIETAIKFQEIQMCPPKMDRTQKRTAAELIELRYDSVHAGGVTSLGASYEFMTSLRQIPALVYMKLGELHC